MHTGTRQSSAEDVVPRIHHDGSWTVSLGQQHCEGEADPRASRFSITLKTSNRPTVTSPPGASVSIKLLCPNHFDTSMKIDTRRQPHRGECMPGRQAELAEWRYAVASVPGTTGFLRWPQRRRPARLSAHGAVGCAPRAVSREAHSINEVKAGATFRALRAAVRWNERPHPCGWGGAFAAHGPGPSLSPPSPRMTGRSETLEIADRKPAPKTASDLRILTATGRRGDK